MFLFIVRDPAGTQIIQLGVFARAFAAVAPRGDGRLVEWSRGRITLEHGLVLGGSLLLVGVVT